MCALIGNKTGAHSISPPGAYTALGRRRVHTLRGLSSPENYRGDVILESALGCPASEWIFLQSHPAELGYNSYAYNRPGVGWTQPTLMPRSIKRHYKDLNQLIAQAKISPGAIINGHSIGGLLAAMNRYFGFLRSSRFTAPKARPHSRTRTGINHTKLPIASEVFSTHVGASSTGRCTSSVGMHSNTHMSISA